MVTLEISIHMMVLPNIGQYLEILTSITSIYYD